MITGADVGVDDITGAWDGDDTGADVFVVGIIGASGAVVVVVGIAGGIVDGSDAGCSTGVLVVVGVGKLVEEGDADDDSCTEIEYRVVVGAFVDCTNSDIVGDCDGNPIADDDGIDDVIDIVEGMPAKTASNSERMEDEYIIDPCFIILYIILSL